MTVERIDGATAFLERAGSFLAAREAQHNLILGLAGRLVGDAHVFGDDDPYFAVAKRDGAIIGAAMRTPPHNVILSEIDDLEACGAFARDVRGVFAAIPGAIGPTDAVAAFASTWAELTGVRREQVLSQCIYEADAVEPPHGVPGGARGYTEADRPLVRAWLEDFPLAADGDAGAFLDRRLADPQSTVLLWEDGDPVSLAMSGSPTPHGIRIGPVYTPPERRRRGYAAAVTAALTQRELALRRYCFLYTDLANPTSNSVYRRIGYRPVGDAAQWRFS